MTVLHKQGLNYVPLCGSSDIDEMTFAEDDRVTCETCKRLNAEQKNIREAKAKAKAIVDAANLRALAAIIEATNQGLSDLGDYDTLSRTTLQRELHKRTQ